VLDRSAGRLKEAYHVLPKQYRTREGTSLLSTLFSACCLDRFRTGKGNREVAYREGSNDPYIYSYCFIKNLSSARNWGRVRLKMKETGLKKNPLVVAGMRLTAESNHSS
jgi:hypothetical protein